MKLEKKFLDDMERCYCASSLTIGGKLHLLLASEAEEGPCYAYSGDGFSQKEVVWEHGGGTMSIVELPGTDGQFLAVQNFYPGFKSARAKIVWGRRDPDKGWLVRDFLFLPYVHRFDVLSRGGVNYFLGSVLCGSKKDREDWSDPGYVCVGTLPDDLREVMPVRTVLTGLVKNHGYWRAPYKGVMSAYVSCEGGVCVLTPPAQAGGEWETARIMDWPVSDLAVYDLDGDGVDELATLEPFHGNRMKIYHRDGEGWREIYSYPHEMNFAHALWAGPLGGKPTVLVGIRRLDCELFTVQPKEGGGFETVVWERGGGPANVTVARQDGRDVILCANHTKNEGALYFVSP